MGLKQVIKKLMRWLLPRTIIFWNDDRVKNTVSITFDDGPHGEFTAPILDLLKKHDVKATFFVIGKHAEQYPDIIIRMIEEGHEIANHSYEHNQYKNGRLSKPVYEVRKTNDIVSQKFGYRIKLYRPPYGAVSPWSLLYCSIARLSTVMWTIDSGDYRQNGNVEASVKSCLDHKKYDGDVLLFHDHNPYTVEILDAVLAELSSRGVNYKTAGQLIYES